MKKRKGYARIDRVSQQLHEILAATLLTEATDPRVENVQITAVDVSSDLRVARVFFTLLLDGSERDRKRAESALNEMAGFLRGRLSAQISMKYIPELRFEVDEALDRGRRIESILAGVLTDEEGEAADEASSDGEEE